MSALLVFNPVLVHTNTAIKGFSFDFETVARILSRRVGPKFGRCKPCGEEIFAPPTNKTAVANGNLVPEYFLISLNFYTTKRCQESFIVEIINELLGKEIKLPIGQEYVTLMISAANEEKYDNFLTFDGHLHVTSANCPMYVFTDFQKLSSCPSVSLNFTDYSALMRSTDQMSKKRQINSLFKQPARKGNAAPNTGNDAPNTGNDAPNTDNDAPNTGNDAPNTGNDAPNTGNDATYKDNDAPNTKTAEEGNVAINTDNFKVQACFETYLSVLPKKNHGFSNGPKMEIILLAVVIISSKCVA